MKSSALLQCLEQPLPFTNQFKMPEILGESAAMQKVFRCIDQLARSPVTVLINGETGCGKELVARALHFHSLRAQKPFIALNRNGS